MEKIDVETKKAIVRIPQEINKLTKVIAIIGESVFNAKTLELKRKKEEFEELLKQNNHKRGIT